MTNRILLFCNPIELMNLSSNYRELLNIMKKRLRYQVPPDERAQLHLQSYHRDQADPVSNGQQHAGALEGRGHDELPHRSAKSEKSRLWEIAQVQQPEFVNNKS